MVSSSILFSQCYLEIRYILFDKRSGRSYCWRSYKQFTTEIKKGYLVSGGAIELKLEYQFVHEMETGSVRMEGTKRIWISNIDIAQRTINRVRFIPKAKMYQDKITLGTRGPREVGERKRREGTSGHTSQESHFHEYRFWSGRLIGRDVTAFTSL